MPVRLVKGIWRFVVIRWKSEQDVLDLLVAFILWAMVLGYVGDTAGPGLAGALIGAAGLFLAFFLAKFVRVPTVEGSQLLPKISTTVNKLVILLT